MPDADDAISHLLRREGSRILAFGSDTVLDVLVLDIRLIRWGRFLENERDRGDDDLALQRMLEDAIAISERTFGI